MQYNLTFHGYTGRCNGQYITSENKKGTIITTNLLIVTVVSVFNSIMLLLVLIFVLARRWRIKQMDKRQQKCQGGL